MVAQRARVRRDRRCVTVGVVGRFGLRPSVAPWREGGREGGNAPAGGAMNKQTTQRRWGMGEPRERGARMRRTLLPHPRCSSPAPRGTTRRVARRLARPFSSSSSSLPAVACVVAASSLSSSVVICRTARQTRRFVRHASTNATKAADVPPSPPHAPHPSGGGHTPRLRSADRCAKQRSMLRSSGRCAPRPPSRGRLPPRNRRVRRALCLAC